MLFVAAEVRRLLAEGRRRDPQGDVEEDRRADAGRGREVRRGVRRRTATAKRTRRAIFDLIEPFAGYAFNKAHSAVYGTIAYQTAYLKANYPHEYMTAVLSQRRRARAHRRGRRRVRAPRHRRAAARRQPQRRRLRAGSSRRRRRRRCHPLRARHGEERRRRPPPRASSRAREEGGPFADIEDFIKRVDLKALNKRALESLIKAGALDALGDRGTLLANLDRIVSLAQREAKLKETGQSTMFDMFGDSVATPLPALELVDAEVSKAEMLSWEKELLGVYVSEHPFSSAPPSRSSKHTSALVSEITPELDGREVVIAGMVNDIRHAGDEGRQAVHRRDGRGSLRQRRRSPSGPTSTSRRARSGRRATSC